jgi:hypothetical protein
LLNIKTLEEILDCTMTARGSSAWPGTVDVPELRMLKPDLNSKSGSMCARMLLRMHAEFPEV